MAELELRTTNSSITNFDSYISFAAIVPKKFTVAILPELRPYLIPKDEIKIAEEPIGTGSSGIVYKGRWKDMDVAVKQLRTEDVEQLMKLQDECRIMKEISSHQNVVQLIGLVENPISIVTEYCSFGSLYEYVMGKHPINMAKRIGILRDIAQGMIHLQKHNIVHRDLASRNCLLADGFITKVSDFGMSRLIIEESISTQNTVGPIKWMAPETFTTMTYSFQTDVYSFGVLCVEVLTRDKPYPDIPMSEFVINVLVKDYASRLPSYLPNNTPASVRDLIMKCVSKNASHRPTFKEIATILNTE
eukprot:TRINITY_DN3946_c0_g1_i1.p1 TRINITY_DN3946_c0_g1~~TRINITY_DN3946_c0_g1_i1.p1  ORF type:complete len:303 (+),score=55.16 TRINITY_DN3946_c0_g1_i1:175-1083(+)